MQKKIIAVVGATGSQGSGLVRAILNDPNSEFSVRAITRNTNSAKAQELAKLGAEVVAADIHNYESLKQALEGAYGAFFVTFFWEHMNAEKEMTEARNMAQAAKEVGLQHAVWSTFEDSRLLVPVEDNRMPTLQEKYKIPHFDSKGSSDQYFIDSGVPTTFLLTTFYWDNFILFGMGPKKDKDGQLKFTIPMGKKKLVGIAVEDIGRCAYGVFKRGNELIGKRVGIYGESLTCEEMAEKMSRALGQKVVYDGMAVEAYRELGFPGADEMGSMFQYYQEFEEEFTRNRSLELSKQLNPELKNFDAWLAENAKKMPLD